MSSQLEQSAQQVLLVVFVEAVSELGGDAVPLEQQAQSARQVAVFLVVEGIDILELTIESVEELCSVVRLSTPPEWANTHRVPAKSGSDLSVSVSFRALLINFFNAL